MRINVQGQNVLGTKHPKGQNILWIKRASEAKRSKGKKRPGQNILGAKHPEGQNILRDKTSFYNIYKSIMFYVIFL
jgi:hypothetical protein